MRARQRGFVLIAMAIALVFLLAVIGLAFDFGRIYIARNEAQVFTDAAALAAAAKLDGTESGLDRARAAVSKLPMRWNMGTKAFSGVTVEFSADGTRWESSPASASGVHEARVTAPNNAVEITFLRVAGGPASFAVAARSVAASGPVRLIE